MAKTTIPVELSSTPGITDNSNATAITIDSSENTTFTNNINVGGIGHVNLSGSASEVSVGVTGDTDNSGGGVSFAHNTSTLNSYVLGQKASMTIGSAISTPLLFVTNNTERSRIDSAGRFAIGVNNPADYYATNLVVQGASEGGITLASTSTSVWNYIMFADGTSGDERYRGYFGYHHGTDQLTMATAGTQKLAITSTGQLQSKSLGVSTPTFSFDNDTDTGMTRPTSDTVQIVTGGTEALRVNGSQQLLIGSTSPLQSDNKLSITGNGSGAGNAMMDIRNTSTSDTCGCIALSKGTTTTSSANRYIWFFTNNFGSNMGAIGGAGLNNVQFVASSDERLKENIKPITGSLDKILALNPVSFDWKANGEHREAGFVAQEVEKVFPEYVSTDDDKMKTKNIGGGMTAGYVAELTKALQEANDKITALEARVKTLEG